MTSTSTKRVTAFREINAVLGRTELRGVYATKQEQEILKKMIKLELERMRKGAL